MRPAQIAKVHKEGWLFVGLFGLVSVMFYALWAPLGCVGFVVTAWCAYFFRDPERVTPTREGLVISPADGAVQAVLSNMTPPAELGLKGDNWTRISIFLNIFDVHINRIPINGKIVKSVYHPGKFFNASLDKASIHNERQSLVVTMKDKRDVAFVQIAGLIARRIRCDVYEGQDVLAGQRFGLIRFGSRMDVFLPENTPVHVIEGQRVVAGETVLADFASKEETRLGEVR